MPISLGRGADRSTFTHELAHLYLWHLKRLAATATEMNGGSWRGPEARWNTDLKAVPRWWDEQAGDIARQAAVFVKDEAARGAFGGSFPRVAGRRYGERGLCRQGL